MRKKTKKKKQGRDMAIFLRPQSAFLRAQTFHLTKQVIHAFHCEKEVHLTVLNVLVTLYFKAISKPLTTICLLNKLQICLA